MNPFSLAQPRTFQEASGLVLDTTKYRLPVLKAGGIDLLDHLKERLIEPDLLVNIRKLRGENAPAPISEIKVNGASLVRIEATATLAEIASSEILLRAAPVLSQSVQSAASPQVRNVATAAGNLLQRPRCWYYRNEQFNCLKKGGPTCFALEGENRYHAIFGDGPCHIVHPSNLAPAIWVCNGVAHVIGGGRSEVPLTELFHTPDRGVRDEHNLKPGEVITHITCELSPSSGFYAIKEKQSFDWPVVAAAVSLVMDGETIKSARVCAAAVAPIPWALPNVEKVLAGVKASDDAGLRKACSIAADGAKPMTDNKYKAKLLTVAVRRAVLAAAGLKTEADA